MNWLLYWWWFIIPTRLLYRRKSFLVLLSHAIVSQSHLGRDLSDLIYITCI